VRWFIRGLYGLDRIIVRTQTGKDFYLDTHADDPIQTVKATNKPTHARRLQHSDRQRGQPCQPERGRDEGRTQGAVRHWVWLLGNGKDRRAVFEVLQRKMLRGNYSEGYTSTSYRLLWAASLCLIITNKT
jgi:hypothetical protein